MRFRRVRINHQILMAMFVEGAEVSFKVIMGLPKDARFIRITGDDIAGIDIVVEHESFAELNDGDIIPLHPEVRVKQWPLQVQSEVH